MEGKGWLVQLITVAKRVYKKFQVVIGVETILICKLIAIETNIN